MAASNEKALPRLIGLEEHWLSSHLDQSFYKDAPFLPSSVLEPLCDAGKGRVAKMDATGIDMQVLSVTAGYGCDTVNYAAANDEMAEKIKAYPSRFAGFCNLPMIDPEKAAAELRRCMGLGGFVGAMVDNHAGGTYYEGPEYDIFWRAAQELDVPIYLHPAPPTEERRKWYQGHYSPAAAMCMSFMIYGWHHDVATHLLRLYAGGVFDRFPKVKIIAGHFGESLPFYLERVKTFDRNWGKIQRRFQEVYDENLWFTTSSLKEVAPLACMLQNTKVERILFAVDYPYLTMEDGIEWIKQVRASGLVTEEQLEMIAHGNAEKFLGIKPKA